MVFTDRNSAEKKKEEPNAVKEPTGLSNWEAYRENESRGSDILLESHLWAPLLPRPPLPSWRPLHPPTWWGGGAGAEDYTLLSSLQAVSCWLQEHVPAGAGARGGEACDPLRPRLSGVRSTAAWPAPESQDGKLPGILHF